MDECNLTFVRFSRGNSDVSFLAEMGVGCHNRHKADLHLPLLRRCHGKCFWLQPTMQDCPFRLVQNHQTMDLAGMPELAYSSVFPDMNLFRWTNESTLVILFS